VIFLLVRWQLRYGSLITDDADYKTARRSWWVSLVMLLALPVLVVMRIVLLLLLARTT
jgi:hypothetical protein